MITKGYAYGVWKPLLFAGIIFLMTLGVIWLVDIFTEAGVPVGRLIELMLDPGAWSHSGAKEQHTVTFQLAVALIGAIVFTSLTITTVSNMFSNMAESYRNGESSLNLKDHIVIIGTNYIFYNSLGSILAEDGVKVILTSQPAKEVRSRISGHLGSDKANEFTIVTGDRRLTGNLERVAFNKAKKVYILGEDNETDHDSANISCFNKLCLYAEKETMIECTLEIDSPEVLLLFSQTKRKMDNIYAKYFNPEELLACNLMFSDTNKKIDFEYLEANDTRRHHLIIVGTSSLSTEIAKMFLNIAHYPNFETQGIKSILTVIDSNDILNLGLQSNLKDVCHIHEYGTSTKAEDSFNSNYFDMLDFEINHIKGKILDRHVRELLTSLYDKNDITHIVISSNDTDQNFKDGISLPHFIYEDDCPVLVYQPATGLIIDSEKLPEYYNNLSQFGLRVSLDSTFDRLYTLINRATAYSDFCMNNLCNGDEDKDQTCYEDNALDSYISKMIGHEMIRGRYNFTDGLYLVHFIMNHKGQTISGESLTRCSHQNWTISKLLLGNNMMTKDMLTSYRKAYDVDRNFRIEIQKSEIKYRQNINIAPYDMLSENSKRFSTIYDKRRHSYLSSKL